MRINKTVKYIFFVIVVMLIGLAIYILNKDGKKEKTNVKDQEIEIKMVKDLNIGITNYDTINPILSKNRDIQYIDKLIFESLLTITDDFKMENQLAKEFSKINDTTYIAKLKEDVYWHDGTNFTAKDVIFTINNLKNNKIDSIYKENVRNIKEVQKIDDYTIKIFLTEETPFFEYMMCFPILASHLYQEGSLNSKTEIPIGTGKFKITKIDKDNILIEKSNNENKSKISKINLIIKESTKELYKLLSKNEIDLMVTENIEYENYIGSLGYNAYEITNREFDYLALNCENGILSNKEIRKAINYSIDKQSINYSAFNNKYTPCNFILDYGSYLYNLDEKNKYDINQAKKVLLEDGWILKNNVWTKYGRRLVLRLLVNEENPKRVAIAENIKSQLSKIGIGLDIIKVNDYSVNNYIKRKNYDIILTGNIVSNNPNLDTYFGDNNLSNYNNEKIGSILVYLKNVDNQENILKEEYTKIEEIYSEEMPFISLYFNTLFILTNKNLKGDLKGNWYNIYYNIDNWYKIENN